VLSAASKLTMQEMLGYDALLCPTVTTGNMEYPVSELPQSDSGYLAILSDAQDNSGNSVVCNVIHTSVARNPDGSLSFKFSGSSTNKAPLATVITPDKKSLSDYK